MVRAKYTLTEADLYDAQVKHAGWNYRFVQVFGALLLTTGAVGIIVLRQYGGVTMVVVGTVMMFWLRLTTKASFKRDFAHQAEVIASVADAGVEFSGRNGSSSINWIAFLKYSETRRCFMLYMQSNIFSVIPKRALTPEETNALRGLLQRHVTTKPKAFADKMPPKTIAFLVVIGVALVLCFLAIRH